MKDGATVYVASGSPGAIWAVDPAQMVIDLQPGSIHCPRGPVTRVNDGATRLGDEARSVDVLTGVLPHGTFERHHPPDLPARALSVRVPVVFQMR